VAPARCVRGGGGVLGRDEELPGSIELAGVPAGLELAPARG
jgi:hypothetical protein